MKKIALFVCITIMLCQACKQKQEKQLENKQFNFVTSDHVSLPVKVSGKGDICMFVPGGPGGGYLSFEQLGGNKLEGFLTMIYMDQRGSGSAQNARDYSMDRLLKDMDDVRAKLGVDKMYLMSHSFGGVIMVNYAKKYPQHVKGLILVNSALYFFSPDALAEQISYGYKLLGKDTVIKAKNPDSLFAGDMAVRAKLSKVHLGYKLLTDSIKTIGVFDKLDSLHPRTNDFAYKILAPVLDKTKKMIYPEYFKDYNTITPDINVPVLVITGINDHAVGPNTYKLAKFPHQKVVKIDGGHLLYYENNSAFVDAVKNFIKDQSVN
ncbi:alpha/beta hydrolase [Mucilaginibacter achroorhodeus]|uniref:Alpha/beta hydrolase n=1 Tax=Mucilaginibacter achroorhodeus TaxID=2599294 RepID=A0A563TZL3_9SPHI|nr:alpha/beta hydrolase [Mucilaginibacter achroorhodeus]TWR24560.1 alpha/beta hydrolase [Mucilaginibacter achroorhodeus]